MAPFSLPVALFPAFFLIAVRCVTALVVAPVFSARPFPLPARVGLGLVLAAVLAPTLGQNVPSLDEWAFPGFVLQEALVGVILGFSAQVIFQVVQMMAGLIELQMGLTFGGLIDPAGATSGAALAQFYGAFATLIFLAFDGHHVMLLGVGESLHVVPLGDPKVLTLSPDRWIALSGTALRSALQIALPVTGALLLADVALAMLARAVPQMNVFLTAMPAKILVGLAAVAVALPVLMTSLGPWVRSIAEATTAVLGGR